MSIRERISLVWVFFIAASVVVALRIGGDAMIPLAVLLLYISVYCRGREHAYEGHTKWLWLVPAEKMRRIPLPLAAVGALLLLAGQPAVVEYGKVSLSAAVFLAAWVLGRRAGVERFTVRDYWRDIVYGNTGLLIVAVLWASLIDALSGVLQLIEVVFILVACAVIAVREEPLFITRGAIFAQRLRAKQRGALPRPR